MNAARNRHASDLVLALSEKSTDELEQMLLSRHNPVALRRAVEHVLNVRRMVDKEAT